MGSLSRLMAVLSAEADDSFGTIDQIEDHRWIIGDGDIFPVQIEELYSGNMALIYATALRETSEPVLLPMMITLFIEGLSGHSLGNYGICPGPITLTLYQKITLNENTQHDRLKAQIACHRLLMECFLMSEYDRSQDLTLLADYNTADQPILPFRH